MHVMLYVLGALLIGVVGSILPGYLTWLCSAVGFEGILVMTTIMATVVVVALFQLKYLCDVLGKPLNRLVSLVQRMAERMGIEVRDCRGVHRRTAR